MVDHMAKLKGLWQKASWLKTVQTIVEEVKMKCHFPEALFLKVMPNNSFEIGLTCMVEASVCFWWPAWQTVFVGTIYATQISVCVCVCVLVPSEMNFTGSMILFIQVCTSAFAVAGWKWSVFGML